MIKRAETFLRKSRRAAAGATGAFTLIEVLLTMVVTGLVAGALFSLMMMQNRGYSKVRETADVHSTLRSTATLLTWDLRYASPADGDLYAIGPNAIELRSVQGTAVICSKAGGGQFGLSLSEGELTAAAESVLVFAVGSFGPADDTWKILELQALPAGGANCAWPGSPPVDARLHVTVAAVSDTVGIEVGGPIRTFRRVEYGTFQWRGRWWAGRRVAGGGWEPLAGPLPDSTGLQFDYYDNTGAVTTTPDQVTSVEVLLRAQSTRRVGATQGVEADSLRFKVNLRG